MWTQSFGANPGGQSVFGGGRTTASFGSSTANPSQVQQQQQQQQQQQNPLGQSQLNQQQLGSSVWQPAAQTAHQKSIPEQIQAVTSKWDPSSPNCAFKTYLYNQVPEDQVPRFGPGPNEDPREWEEALQNKPAPNHIPVLAAGFPSIIARLALQKQAISGLNSRLHSINASLDNILSRHDLEHTVRALNARRRHALQKKRCLALASKVQVLRNRGYSLSSDEDELKLRLQQMEKGLQDPAMSARMEELWSRLIIIRGYAENLKTDLARQGQTNEGLGEEVEAKAKKILEDYEKQLQHLRKEVDQITKDYAEWEKEHSPVPPAKR